MLVGIGLGVSEGRLARTLSAHARYFDAPVVLEHDATLAASRRPARGRSAAP
jgi:hypothetical protein